MKVGYDTVIRIEIDRDTEPFEREAVKAMAQNFFNTPGLLPANITVKVMQMGKVTLEADLPAE